jgi:hypothetical protein
MDAGEQLLEARPAVLHHGNGAGQRRGAPGGQVGEQLIDVHPL